MSKLRILSIVFAVIAVALLGLAGYLGVFLSVDVSEEEMGPYRLIYRPIETVEFDEVGRITDEVATMLDGLEITDRAPMQVYYPDGRAEIGFVVGEDIRSLNLSDGTTLRTVPRQTMMTAVFPWRHPVSFLVAGNRIPAAFEDYRQLRDFSEAESMTVYRGTQILYLQPVRP